MSDADKFGDWMDQQPELADVSRVRLNADIPALDLPSEAVYQRLEAKALRFGAKDTEQARELLLGLGNITGLIFGKRLRWKLVGLWLSYAIRNENATKDKE
jgi:hypothetical protein